MPDDVVPEESGPGGTSPLPDTRDVIVLEPGGEQAQKIAKAMGSQTAGDILQLLKTGPKTSTEITDQLSIPMGTAKYHIENLLDAGLIEVTKTKYSVKGREVKVYGLKDQLLIVTPRVVNVRALLLKYASLFGIVAIATVVIGAVLQVLSPSTGYISLAPDMKKASIEVIHTAPLASPAALNGGAQGVGFLSENMSRSPGLNDLMTLTVTSAPPENVYSQVQLEVISPAGFPLSDLILAFFLGGCLVIGVLILYELVQRRK
jgi:DNA-binding transcriptional ArsR family regulator